MPRRRRHFPLGPNSGIASFAGLEPIARSEHNALLHYGEFICAERDYTNCQPCVAGTW